MTWNDLEKKLLSTIAVLPARVTRFLRGRVLSGPTNSSPRPVTSDDNTREPRNRQSIQTRNRVPCSESFDPPSPLDYVSPGREGRRRGITPAGRVW